MLAGGGDTGRGACSLGAPTNRRARALWSLQVFLNGSQGQVYHSQQVGPPGSAVSPDLLVDGSGSYVYVLTARQVRLVPGQGGHTWPKSPNPPPPSLATRAGGPGARGGLFPVP